MPREKITRKGKTYFLQSTGRYFQDGNQSSPERLLHRVIWIELNGPIPEGMHVHHRNGDWRDNSPENLQLLTGQEHFSLHAKEAWSDPERAKKMMAGLEKGRPAASAWHGSEEGRELSRRNGLLVSSRLVWITGKCAVCSEEFKTTTRKPRDTCSRRCWQRRNKVNYLVSRTCLICGSEYKSSRYINTRFCSITCVGVNNRKSK